MESKYGAFDSEKLLGATVRGCPQIHGLYLQELYQVHMVKSQERFLRGSGRRTEDYPLGNMPSAFTIMKAYYPGKILHQNLILSGEIALLQIKPLEGLG